MPLLNSLCCGCRSRKTSLITAFYSIVSAATISHGLMSDCSKSSALALKSCTTTSMYSLYTLTLTVILILILTVALILALIPFPLSLTQLSLHLSICMHWYLPWKQYQGEICGTFCEFIYHAVRYEKACYIGRCYNEANFLVECAFMFKLFQLIRILITDVSQHLYWIQ